MLFFYLNIFSFLFSTGQALQTLAQLTTSTNPILTLPAQNAELYTSNTNLNTPFDIDIYFTMSRDSYTGEILLIDLPRFTRTMPTGLDFRSSSSAGVSNTNNDTTYPDDFGSLTTRAGADLAFGSVAVSPSLKFEAAWVEGTAGGTSPYEDSQMQVRLINSFTLSKGDIVHLTFSVANRISAYCGLPSSSEYYNNTGLFYPTKVPSLYSKIFNTVLNQYIYATDDTGVYVDANTGRDLYNATKSSSFAKFSEYNIPGRVNCGNALVKSALAPKCFNNGYCDYCLQKCVCIDGYGSDNDVVVTGRDLDITCRRKVCPTGLTVAGLASSATLVHNTVTECSNQGVCNRNTGVCMCYPPFSGVSCEKLNCPGDGRCSGHGTCLSMSELAFQNPVLSKPTPVNSATNLALYHIPSQPLIRYGTASSLVNYSTWDLHSVRGCKCDSSWAVGYAQFERQISEYFGPDCSLRHCPSGDNPYTLTDEEDCHNKRQLEDGLKILTSDQTSLQLGMQGNRCHIECSNRGKCDYTTGKCTCFEGSWGESCSLVDNGGNSVQYVRSSLST